MTDSSIEAISQRQSAAALSRVRAQRPLVQCITNDVVQEITANVLLAAGMSPAMGAGLRKKPAAFAQFAADALLCNVGTPSEENSRGMKLAAATMSEAGKPWTLDPVGAGGTAWRDDLISDLIDLRPTVIRGMVLNSRLRRVCPSVQGRRLTRLQPLGARRRQGARPKIRRHRLRVRRNGLRD